MSVKRSAALQDRVYLQDLCKQFHIVFVQEHWDTVWWIKNCRSFTNVKTETIVEEVESRKDTLFAKFSAAVTKSVEDQA